MKTKIELKEEIRIKSEWQRFLKRQRKTANFEGERVIDPKKATYEHKSNRIELSAMFVAYRVLKGHDLEEELKNHVSKKDPYAMNYARKQVEKLLEEYKVIERETVE